MNLPDIWPPSKQQRRDCTGGSLTLRAIWAMSCPDFPHLPPFRRRSALQRLELHRPSCYAQHAATSVPNSIGTVTYFCLSRWGAVYGNGAGGRCRGHRRMRDTDQLTVTTAFSTSAVVSHVPLPLSDRMAEQPRIRWTIQTGAGLAFIATAYPSVSALLGYRRAPGRPALSLAVADRTLLPVVQENP